MLTTHKKVNRKMKPLTTQHALPKSAILTLILSEFSGSKGLTRRLPAVSLAARG